MKKFHILLIEDEQDITELVRYNLERENFTVTAVQSGEKALDVLAERKIDLVLLDLMLPGMDGLETCRLIKARENTAGLPIIMLTAKSEESDVVIGLQIGADDYITKPFSPKVLLARIKAVLRRFREKTSVEDVRTLGEITIDLPKHKVSLQNKPVALTTIEFKILEFLSRRPGRVFSRDQILDEAWKEGKFIVDRAVDVHIRALRKKLKKAAEYIETVRGAGYRFKEIESSL